MLKKTMVVFFVLSILLVNSVGYAAADDELIVVYSSSLNYITSTSCYLNISTAGLADMTASIAATYGVDSVRINMYLQRYNSGWVTVDSWNQTYYSNRASMYQSQYVPSGYNYRILVYFYAYDGGAYESTSSTSYDSY